MSTESSRPLRDARELEGAARDPLDLARVVLARVEDGAVVADAARAVVEAADELAHDQQVDPVARAPAGGSRRRRARLRSPIRPASGRTAPPSHFGPPTAPSSTASAARHARERLRRQRIADRVDRGAAEGVLLDLDLERQRPEHAHGLRHHLGPDPVAGQADDRLVAMELPPGQVEHMP